MTTTGPHSRLDVAYHVPRARLAEEQTHLARLTLTPKDAGYGCESFVAYRLTDDTLSVPRFYGLRHFGPADEDGTAQGDDVSLTFTGTLTEPQSRALEALAPTPETPTDHAVRGGVLVLPCGFGKTVAAIKHICDVGKRTLVLVTKSFLADQWQLQIQRFTASTTTIGRIQRDTVQLGDITIALVQSLVARDYGDDVLGSFGLVVVDEAHHMAARAFSQALWRVRPARLLALSATPERADGLEQLLFWSMGDIAFRISRDNAEALEVRQCVYKGRVVPDRMSRAGQLNLSAMVTALCADERRTRSIAECVRRRAEAGHFVLVLSDRIAHLQSLATHLTTLGLDDGGVGWYVGSTPAAERHRVERESRVILSSYAMAKEGLDIPRLSCLVLATPKGDVEQAVGRIQRPWAGKKSPVVEDVVDPYSIFAALSWKRRRFFQKQGYECTSLPLAEVDV
tara:strand:- start:448 stop:1809 length:1362 start_codon:yes stop_codon:yes gene_type:complete